MSKVFFDELGIPEPDFNLEVGSGSHAVQTARIMEKFEPVLLNAFAPAAATSAAPSSNHRARPDWVVVVGDVNSTLACTLVAAKLGVRVAHVEAGLRSFDRSMPEEINRIVTDSLADLLLTPSDDAGENLRREGVPARKIRLVGNIMIDSLVANLPKAEQSGVLANLGLQPGGYIYVTLHRPANVDDPAQLRPIVTELERLAGKLGVIFPMHPRTRSRLAEFGISIGQGLDARDQKVAGPKLQTSNPKPQAPSSLALAPCSARLLLLDPLGYHDSLALTRHARCVLTDSGGLQEESTWFRTPCLTLRPNTERPVTVTLGSNRLTTVGRLQADLEQVLRGEDRLGQIPPLWDGQTAERIVSCLIQHDHGRPTDPKSNS
jgi:UDP-N-acetylglucosamine 2-epimerase (non-hydrolysing)